MILLGRLGRLLSLAVMLALVLSGRSEAAGGRVAMVIGNGGYRSVDRLTNPANDARLLAATLQAAGFKLVGGGPLLDLDKAHFDRAVQNFGSEVQGADVALFYYSGHGMQVGGTNWLVPVDANPSGQRDLDFQMVDVSLVLRQMEHAGTRLNMLILDACRNNPFAVRGIRASGGGLAEMNAPEGTLISYATQPGNVASDGGGANSPYTAALVGALRSPGVDIFRVFNRVGLTVKAATGGQQQPWLASSPIAGDFYFFNGPVTINLAPPALPVGIPAPAPVAIEQRMRRFDGHWIATFDCSATSDALAYKWVFPVEIVNGALHGVRGTVGLPSSMTLDGRLTDDGNTLLYGVGMTGNPAYSVGQIASGRTFSFHASARFAGNHGEGFRTEVRPCRLLFER